MVGTEAIIRHALQEGTKITLVVNKIDRLILELRIKPADAYYKIKHTIEEINTFIRFVFTFKRPHILTLYTALLTRTLTCGSLPRRATSRSRALTWAGASRYVHSLRCTLTHMVRRLPAEYGFLLTKYVGPLDVQSFADRLWGDIYFNNDTRKFTRKQSDPEHNRSFIQFILDPLYKLYSHVLSEETEELKETLHGLGIHLKPIMFKMDVRPLLKVILDQFFGPTTGLVDMIVEHIPSPVEAAAAKVCFVSLLSYSCSSFRDCRSNIHTQDLKHRIWLLR